MSLAPDLDQPMFFCMPPRTLLAEGARHRVAALCAAQGWRRAAIVTDRFFTGHTAVVSDLCGELRAVGIEPVVHDGGEPDPSTTLCDRVAAELAAQAGDVPFDHVIAIGGGSNIDLAKAVCLALPHRRPIVDFVGRTDWPGPPLPLVAIPTTAGTGSEITPGAILVQPDSATKVAVMRNDLRPRIAVIDPALTLSCPAKVTADAGLDALAHAIESLLTMDAARFDTGGDPDPGYSGRNPLTNLLALQAIDLAFRHLETAWRSPDDRAARTGMAWASLLAAMSYGSAGLNAVHGLAYALAGMTHASHGSTNAVLLPYVMDALIGYRDGELAEIARLAGVPDGPVPTLAAQAPVRVRALVGAVGLPTTLAGFGVTIDRLDELVRDGLAVTRLAKAFPVPDVARAYASIVDNAFHGRLSGG